MKSEWIRPRINHGEPCRFGYTVYYPENFTLGENCDVGWGTFIQAQHGVYLGENTQIGGHCQIYSADSEGGYAGPVKIGQCCNIGTDTTIFPNVTIVWFSPHARSLFYCTFYFCWFSV